VTDQHTQPTTNHDVDYHAVCGSQVRITAEDPAGRFGGFLAVLMPGTGGDFEVWVDNETIWSREARGTFPDLAELKRLIRDRIASDRHLGHSERR
jgi:hypothetical protein